MSITKELIEEQFAKSLESWKNSHPESTNEEEIANRNEAFKIIESIRDQCREAYRKVSESSDDSEQTKKQKAIAYEILSDVSKQMYGEFMKGQLMGFGTGSMPDLFKSFSSMFISSQPNPQSTPQPDNKPRSKPRYVE